MAKKIEQKVTAEEFVKAWQTSESIDQVAEKTGLEVSTCKVKASQFRHAGIPLQMFRAGPRGPKAGGKRLDIAALAELAKASGPVCDPSEVNKPVKKRTPKDAAPVTAGSESAPVTEATAEAAQQTAEETPAPKPVRGLGGKRVNG